MSRNSRRKPQNGVSPLGRYGHRVQRSSIRGNAAAMKALAEKVTGVVMETIGDEWPDVLNMAPALTGLRTPETSETRTRGHGESTSTNSCADQQRRQTRSAGSTSASSHAVDTSVTQSGTTRTDDATCSNNSRADQQRRQTRSTNSITTSSRVIGTPVTRSRATRTDDATSSNNSCIDRQRRHDRSTGSTSTSPRTVDTPVTPSVTITTNDESSSSSSRADSGVEVHVYVPQRSRDRHVADGSSIASSPPPGPSASSPVRAPRPNHALDAEAKYCASLSSIQRLQRDVGLAREPRIETGELTTYTIVKTTSNTISDQFWPRLARLFDKQDWQDKFFLLLEAREYDPEMCIMSKLLRDRGMPDPRYEGGKTYACEYCVDNRTLCARLIYYKEKKRLCVAALPPQRRRGMYRDPTYWVRPAVGYL